MSIGTITKNSFKTLVAAPLLLLMVQAPQGMVDAAEYFAEKAWGERETLLMGAFALVAFIIGVVPSALTFVIVWKKEKTAQGILRHFDGKWKLLILSSCISGVLFALGVMAYLIPGILLMAFYLFVPYLILTEPKGPIFSYFYRSSVITSRNFLKVMAVVLSALFLFVTFQSLGEMLGAKAASAVFNEIFGNALLVIIILIFSMAINAAVNIWLSHFFLSLHSEKVSADTRSKSQKIFAWTWKIALLVFITVVGWIGSLSWLIYQIQESESRGIGRSHYNYVFGILTFTWPFIVWGMVFLWRKNKRKG